MKIVLAGGSGFLGSALIHRLQTQGAAVAVLTRQPRSGVQEDVAWTPNGSVGEWIRVIDDADVVINLVGASIGGARWTARRKEELRASRLLATRSLVAALQQAKRSPQAFVSMSGVGYYGARGDEIVTEDTPPGGDFLAGLCVEWEREAAQASAVTRVVIIRNGLVFHPEGGALRQMLLPFRLGAGGVLGSGRQYLPWIHRQDWIDLVLWLSADTRASGAFNATSPETVTNAEFTKTLGRVLRRPTVLSVPGFGLRLLLGELAGALLTGQRVVPARALAMGFQFKFPSLELALRDLLAY